MIQGEKGNHHSLWFLTVPFFISISWESSFSDFLVYKVVSFVSSLNLLPLLHIFLSHQIWKFLTFPFNWKAGDCPSQSLLGNNMGHNQHPATSYRYQLLWKHTNPKYPMTNMIFRLLQQFLKGNDLCHAITTSYAISTKITHSRHLIAHENPPKVPLNRPSRAMN